MATKRKVSQRPSARLMRRATAYRRLAAKAHHAGQMVASSGYTRRANDLQDRAVRMAEREQARR